MKLEIHIQTLIWVSCSLMSVIMLKINSRADCLKLGYIWTWGPCQNSEIRISGSVASPSVWGKKCFQVGQSRLGTTTPE